MVFLVGPLRRGAGGLGPVSKERTEGGGGKRPKRPFYCRSLKDNKFRPCFEYNVKINTLYLHHSLGKYFATFIP